MNDINMIENLTNLAFNYGPFFFAVILIFYLWMKTKKNYTEICIRKEPKPKEKEINTHRLVFVSTSIMTALFIIFCSVLWLFFKLKNDEHIYHFSLVDISEYEILTPRGDPIFGKKIPQGLGELTEPKYVQDYILISKKELDKNDTVTISYMNIEDNDIYGIIEFYPIEMSGKRYRIKKINGKVEKVDDKISLKLEGPILAKRSHLMFQSIAKIPSEPLYYCYNSLTF